MNFEIYYSMLILFGFILGSIYGGYDIAINKKDIYKIENILLIFLYALVGLIIAMFTPFLIPCFIIGIISYKFVKFIIQI